MILFLYLAHEKLPLTTSKTKVRFPQPLLHTHSKATYPKLNSTLYPKTYHSLLFPLTKQYHLFSNCLEQTLKSFYYLPSLSFPISNDHILSILSPVCPPNLSTLLISGIIISFPDNYKPSLPDSAFHFHPCSHFPYHITKVLFVNTNISMSFFCSKYFHNSLTCLE